TAAEGRYRFFASWRVTRGRVRPLFVLMLLVLLMIVLAFVTGLLTLFGFLEVAAGMLRWRANSLANALNQPLSLGEAPWLGGVGPPLLGAGGPGPLGGGRPGGQGLSRAVGRRGGRAAAGCPGEGRRLPPAAGQRPRRTRLDRPCGADPGHEPGHGRADLRPAA